MLPENYLPRQISPWLHQKILSQPQSITQKGVHARPLTAREREHWFFAAFQPFSGGDFRASIARTPFCAILWRSPKFSVNCVTLQGPIANCLACRGVCKRAFFFFFFWWGRNERPPHRAAVRAFGAPPCNLEVLTGQSEFPILPVNCSCLLLSLENEDSEEKERIIRTKNEEMRRKTKKKKKNKTNIKKKTKIRGEIIYAPPPPSPYFLAKRHFSGEGGGGVYLSPHEAGILYAPPPFYTPPTPRRVFSGVGGVGVYKIRPRTKSKQRRQKQIKQKRGNSLQPHSHQHH